MILSSGERAVWAAAFARERAEQLRWVDDMNPHGKAYKEAIQSAICEARAAVADLREELRGEACAGVDAEDEATIMLRAMLGEE